MRPERRHGGTAGARQADDEGPVGEAGHSPRVGDAYRSGPLRDHDPGHDQRATDGDRHGDVVAEDERSEDEPRHRLQELQRRDPWRSLPGRAPSTSRGSRGSTSRPRGRAPRPTPSPLPAARRRARGAQRGAVRARTSRAARPRASSRGSRGHAAAASRPRRTRPTRTALPRGRAGPAERRVARRGAATGDQHDLADEGDRAPREPSRAWHPAGDERRIEPGEDRAAPRGSSPRAGRTCAAARPCRRPGR